MTKTKAAGDNIVASVNRKMNRLAVAGLLDESGDSTALGEDIVGQRISHILSGPS